MIARSKQDQLSPESILKVLKRKRQTTAELAKYYGCRQRDVKSLLGDMSDRGHLVYLIGDHWQIEKSPPIAGNTGHQFESDASGRYRFGFSSDQHLGSKYERLDVLNDLYDRFAAAGVDRVYNSGNWIEGESRFNKHELLVHGMDQQCEYLAEHYPQRKGITTYAIAGDDHEGWYSQREGIDIGRHAERFMRDADRADWAYLGFMESYVPLIHQKTRKMSRMLTMHPGGGSAYAVSYKPQKIVESLEGGSKPAVLLIGHYHKLSYNFFRNVHCIQAGTTQDQSTFMRKKGLQAHVGGGICTLEQDENGAIIGCAVEFFTYFDRGYYNNRWSHSGPVTLPDRGVDRRRRRSRK